MNDENNQDQNMDTAGAPADDMTGDQDTAAVVPEENDDDKEGDENAPAA